jgi:glucose/arabinose dehydrogenase
MRTLRRHRRWCLPLLAVILTVATCSPATSDPSRAPSAPSAPSDPTGAPSTPADPSPSESAVAFDPGGLQVTLETVADGFDAPLAVVHAADGSGRIFVVEQGGRIRVVRDGQVHESAFLDIAERITAGGERGLLGLAFHPRFPEDPRLFVYYTAAADGANTVASYRVSAGDADRADPGSEEILLAIDDPFGNHNGGALAFGPDGFLYIATGDGGSGGDPLDSGQRTDTLLGKILRIDVDATEGDRGYGIPPGNPFSGADGQPEIWLLGLRNPWRVSFDRLTGDLWIGDVGQGAWEEIDVQRAGQPGGTNYGWNRMEGSHCRVDDCPEEFTLPVAEYGHDVGCTVIGGYVYRGTEQRGLAGAYVFADYCSGNVWVIDPAGAIGQEPHLVAETQRSISSFGEDEAGELYATDLAGGDLLRVVAAAD